MLAMAVGRATLYKQFDRALLVAIGFYGVFAYATRHITPLVNAYLDVYLSWRWMYWAYVPVGVVAAVLVWRFIRPDRPPKPMHVPIDWLAITVFVAWVVAVVFAFAWYRKWGGWSSNAFAATVALCVALPVVLVAWLGSGFSPDEHLKRLLRTRVYVLCADDARADAPAHGGRADDRRHVLHRAARLPADHGGLADGADLGDDGGDDLPHDLVPPPVAAARLAGRRDSWGRRPASGGCRRSTTSRPRSTWPVMLACWGAFLGLIPPVFLTDEIEGLDPKDMLYAGALGIVGLVVPIITVPTATGTVIKAWSDRALDVYRLNLRENRPAVEQASARVADYFHQRGLSGAGLQQETSRVLGGFATLESVAHGFRSGLRFLSLMMLGIGLVVADLARLGRAGIAGAARVGLHLMHGPFALGWTAYRRSRVCASCGSAVVRIALIAATSARAQAPSKVESSREAPGPAPTEGGCGRRWASSGSSRRGSRSSGPTGAAGFPWS